MGNTPWGLFFKGVIRKTLRKCSWVTSSRRLDRLVKYAVWRGSNKLGW